MPDEEYPARRCITPESDENPLKKRSHLKK